MLFGVVYQILSKLFNPNTLSHDSKKIFEWFSIEYRKTKTKPITYQLDYSASLKPK